MKLDSVKVTTLVTTVVLKRGLIVKVPARRIDIYNNGNYSVLSFEGIDESDIDYIGCMNAYRNIEECRNVEGTSMVIRLEDILEVHYKQY